MFILRRTIQLLQRRFNELIHAANVASRAQSLLLLGVFALAITCLEWIGNLPYRYSWWAIVAARLGWVVYFYLWFRKSASGIEGRPTVRDYRDVWSTLVVPLLHFAWIGCWSAMLLHLTMSRVMTWGDFLEEHRLRIYALFRTDFPSVYVGGVLLLSYLPGAWMASALNDRIRISAFPWRAISLTLRFPLLLVSQQVVTCFLVLLTYLLATVAFWFQEAVPIPFASRVLRHVVTLWPVLVWIHFLSHDVRTILSVDKRDQSAR